jgi:hypothetical protein
VNRHCPTPPRFRIQVNRIRDHRCTVSLGGVGSIYTRGVGLVPAGSHAEIFFRGGGDLIIFPTSNNFKRSRIRCPSEPQAFSNACAKLVSGWVFPRQNLAHLFSAGGGPSKVPSSRTGTVGLPHTNGRRIRRNFFWTARRARSKGYWRGLRRPINRRAAGGRSGTPGDASMAASRPMGGYGKV